MLAGGCRLGFLPEEEGLEMDGGILSCRVFDLDCFPGPSVPVHHAGKGAFPDTVLELSLHSGGCAHAAAGHPECVGFHPRRGVAGLRL